MLSARISRCSSTGIAAASTAESRRTKATATYAAEGCGSQSHCWRRTWTRAGRTTGAAQRLSAEEIINYLDDTVAGLFQGTSPTLEQADIDGDGQFDPFTDGIILSLYATSAALDTSESQQLIYTPGIWEDSVEMGVPIVKSLIETSFGTFQNAADSTPPTLSI